MPLECCLPLHFEGTPDRAVGNEGMALIPAPGFQILKDISRRIVICLMLELESFLKPEHKFNNCF